MGAQVGDGGGDDFEEALDVGFGVVGPGGEAEAAGGEFGRYAHGEEDEGRFEGGGSAGGAAGGGDAGAVELQEQTFGLDAGEADVGVVGEAVGGVAVEVQVGDALQAVVQEAGEVGAVAIVGVPVAAGDFEGGGHTDDEGDVFGAGATAALLGAALYLGYDAGSTADVEDADALGPVKFVGGEGEEIDAEVVDVERQGAGGLDGVSVEGDAGAFEESGDFCERLDGADLVVGVPDADEGEVVAEQSLQVPEVDDAVPIDTEVIDAGAAVAA